MKRPHGPKELGQEGRASLGLSDDNQMSRLPKPSYHPPDAQE